MSDLAHPAPGHLVRLGRLLDPETKRTVVLPLDHGMVMGPQHGITVPRDTVYPRDVTIVAIHSWLET